MSRQTVLNRLEQHRHELRSNGVKSLALFGSAARDEATDISDVDLLVEFDRPIGLFGLSRLKRRFEQLLGADKVDLITREGLHPALRDRILSEAVDVF